MNNLPLSILLFFMDPTEKISTQVINRNHVGESVRYSVWGESVRGDVAEECVNGYDLTDSMFVSQLDIEGLYII
jgi:hypothetical protein